MERTRLILERKAGQAVWIDDVRVLIEEASSSGRKVKLVIEAPRDVVIVREELKAAESV